MFRMKKPILHAGLALAFLSTVTTVAAADAARQADVARRGADVMPFNLAATQHVFTRTADGGTQRVVARQTGDAAQVRLVRQHLREIEGQFRQGDFSGPAHIHGADMPGLAQLQAAPRGAVAISYRDVPGGAELAYRTADQALVGAVHAWFDAQVSDHGRDGRAGHSDAHGKHHR